jgi:hypothetical protein
MKVMMKVSSIFVLLMMVVSCATTPSALPEKYNLDNYLEEVDQISSSTDTECENVDNQSIILRANWSDYYLLVLDRPMDIRYSQQSIYIENTVVQDAAYSARKIVTENRDADRGDFAQAPSSFASTASGYDKVVVNDFGGIRYFGIERIYKLDGREQAEQIKEWLRRN